MSEPLHDFYMGALEAELTCAPAGPFSARMASYHCRTLLALEANPKDDTSGRPCVVPGGTQSSEGEG